MKELYKLLTKDEFNRFLYNVYFSKSRSLSFEDGKKKTTMILSKSFKWDQSKEGRDYWLKIYIKLGIYEKITTDII